ncbi:MAG: hypothetical protein OES09_11005 [Gammaproteobacteria bacterium]|nr:hypothetical protein [Gammaproteobacteria bacterium]
MLPQNRLWNSVEMKTMLERLDQLMRHIKIRAVEHDLKLKDVMAQP